MVMERRLILSILQRQSTRREPRLALACAWLALALTASACSEKNPAGPSGFPTPNSAIVYTALGASDANGVGSSVECFPFSECANGMGYVPVARRQLQGQGFTVNLRNMGIPAAVISPEFQSIGNQYNRDIPANFIQQEAPFTLQDSTLVTIYAGGNEVNTITSALGGGAGGSNPSGYIDTQVRLFGTNFATLLDIVRSRAPSARIVVLNLPNLGGLPYLAGAPLAQRQAAQRISVGMSTTVINPLVSQNVTVIDMMCDARYYQRSSLSADGFHPNDAGYSFMAAEVVRAATGPYPTPQASCGQMTLVP
ncbi:MAG: SGNH/GDSL hydrolase family protein [Vicinamibacterales bacterium]